MWQIAHTPNHLCWSCIKFDDVTIRITDRKNVLYRLLDFKCINQNFSKHAEWITLRMFFVVAEVTLNIRSQSSITTSQRRLFSSTTRLKPQFRPSSLESFSPLSFCRLDSDPFCPSPLCSLVHPQTAYISLAHILRVLSKVHVKTASSAIHAAGVSSRPTQGSVNKGS